MLPVSNQDWYAIDGNVFRYLVRTRENVVLVEFRIWNPERAPSKLCASLNLGGIDLYQERLELRTFQHARGPLESVILEDVSKLFSFNNFGHEIGERSL